MEWHLALFFCMHFLCQRRRALLTVSLRASRPSSSGRLLRPRLVLPRQMQQSLLATPRVTAPSHPYNSLRLTAARPAGGNLRCTLPCHSRQRLPPPRPPPHLPWGPPPPFQRPLIPPLRLCKHLCPARLRIPPLQRPRKCKPLPRERLVGYPPSSRPHSACSLHPHPQSWLVELRIQVVSSPEELLGSPAAIPPLRYPRARGVSLCPRP